MTCRERKKNVEKKISEILIFFLCVFWQSNPYGLKDSGPPGADMGAWTSAGLQPTTGYYPYDPALAAYGYVHSKMKWP